VSLEPPIRQGHTSYPHLVMHFPMTHKTTTNPNITEDMDKKYKDKIKPETGETYKIVANYFKQLARAKVTGVREERSFQRYDTSLLRHSDFDPCLVQMTNMRSSALTKQMKDFYILSSVLSFSFINLLFTFSEINPFIFSSDTIFSFDEISSLEFARVRMGNESNRTFDVETNLKNGTTVSFTSIHRQEYTPFFHFVTQKGLSILNLETGDLVTTQHVFDFSHLAKVGGQVADIDIQDMREESNADTKWDMRSRKNLDTRLKVRHAMQTNQLTELDDEEGDEDWQQEEEEENDELPPEEFDENYDSDKEEVPKESKKKRKKEKEDGN